MFIIDCPICEAEGSQARQLVTNKHIESVHRTSEGMVAYVRCANGHIAIHRLADAYPKPKPPASVIEFAERRQADAAA